MDRLEIRHRLVEIMNTLSDAYFYSNKNDDEPEWKNGFDSDKASEMIYSGLEKIEKIVDYLDDGIVQINDMESAIRDLRNEIENLSKIRIGIIYDT